MRTLTAVTLIGLAGAAWFVIRRSTDVSLPEPTVAVELRADCAAVDSADYFFPPQIFRPWAGSPDDAPRVYYGLFLEAMEEPSLSCEYDQPDAYRLTRLDWTGVPLTVRIVNSKNITLSWTKLEAPTWLLPPGNLMGRGTTSVELAAWSELESALETAGFWRIPTNEPRNGQDDPGTAWIVEGRRGRQYHIVNRSSPRDTPYRDAGLVFLRLAGIREEELEANAPGVTFRPFRQPPHIPGLPPPPEPPPPPPPPRSKSRR